MTKRAFDKIKQGLDEARAFLEGTADKARFRAHVRPRKPTLDEMAPAAARRARQPARCHGRTKLAGGRKIA